MRILVMTFTDGTEETFTEFQKGYFMVTAMDADGVDMGMTIGPASYANVREYYAEMFDSISQFQVHYPAKND